MTAIPPFMSADPRPWSVSPSRHGTALPLAGTVSRCPPSRTRRSRPSAVRSTTLSPTRSTAHRGAVARRRASTRSAIGALVTALRRHRAQLLGEPEEIGHVVAPFSRRRSLSAALSWRSPSDSRLMTSAHGMPNSPPGNDRGRVAETTTLQSGMTHARDLRAGVGVDHRDRPREDEPGTEHRAVAHPRAVDDHAPGADERVVTHHDRYRPRRLEHPADADAAGEVDPLADLRAGADRRPRVDHRVGADVRADVHVARHHDHARREVRAPAGRRAGDDAHTGRLVVLLQRDLVAVLERAELGGLHVREPEQQQDRLLEPLVHHDVVADPLRRRGPRRGRAGRSRRARTPRPRSRT